MTTRPQPKEIASQAYAAEAKTECGDACQLGITDTLTFPSVESTQAHVNKASFVPKVVG